MVVQYKSMISCQVSRKSSAGPELASSFISMNCWQTPVYGGRTDVPKSKRHKDHQDHTNKDLATMTTPNSSNDEKGTGNTWLWVEEDRSESEPLLPVNEHDDRPAVKDLIKKFKTKIDQVRENLEEDPLYEAKKHDRLWILRFVLSQKSVVNATKAAKETLVYRKQKGYDNKDIRHDTPGPNCSFDNVRRYFACVEEGSLVNAIPHPQRSVLLFIRWAGFDQDKLVRDLTIEEWPIAICVEWTFQNLDSITRKTGRLTKSIRIVDLEGFKLRQINRENVNRDANIAKDFEDYYPQALQSLFITNAPSWFYSIFRLFRPLLPKRYVEKFNVINPGKNKNEAALLLKHLAEEDLPKKYGGKLEDWPAIISTVKVIE